MEELSSAFKPCSEDVARAAEEAERDKARYEAEEAKSRSTQSLLSAIAQAKGMAKDAEHPDEKMIYEQIVKDLMADVSKRHNS